MFNLYENTAIDQIIDRVARTNSASRTEQTAFKYTPAPSSRHDWPAAFKLARIISQRSRGYRVKRFVAGETTAFSRLTTPRDVVTRESERERENDVALPDNEVRFPAITTSWQWNRRIHHSRIIPLGSVITESVESS